jgi:hypothetical protein
VLVFAGAEEDELLEDELESLLELDEVLDPESDEGFALESVR